MVALKWEPPRRLAMNDDSRPELPPARALRLRVDCTGPAGPGSPPRCARPRPRPDDALGSAAAPVGAVKVAHADGRCTSGAGTPKPADGGRSCRWTPLGVRGRSRCCSAAVSEAASMAREVVVREAAAAPAGCPEDGSAQTLAASSGASADEVPVLVLVGGVEAPRPGACWPARCCHVRSAALPDPPTAAADVRAEAPKEVRCGCTPRGSHAAEEWHGTGAASTPVSVLAPGGLGDRSREGTCSVACPVPALLPGPGKPSSVLAACQEGVAAADGRRPFESSAAPSPSAPSAPWCSMEGRRARIPCCALSKLLFNCCIWQLLKFHVSGALSRPSPPARPRKCCGRTPSWPSVQAGRPSKLPPAVLPCVALC